MRRLVVALVAVLAAATATLFAHARAAADADGFRTPDAGAACRLEPGALVCGSLGSSRAIAVRGRGSPSLVRRLPWWDASTPVLTRWRHGTISCTLRRATILCRNGGTTFAVDRAGLSVGL